MAIEDILAGLAAGGGSDCDEGLGFYCTDTPYKDSAVQAAQAAAASAAACAVALTAADGRASDAEAAQAAAEASESAAALSAASADTDATNAAAAAATAQSAQTAAEAARDVILAMDVVEEAPLTTVLKARRGSDSSWQDVPVQSDAPSDTTPYWRIDGAWASVTTLAHVHTIADLSSGAEASGRLIQADGAGGFEFVDPGVGGGITTIAAATDVLVDTPADLELLAYMTVDGKWHNRTLAEAGVSAVGHDHAGVYDPAGTAAAEVAALEATLGTAAYTASTAYDAAGDAAAAVAAHVAAGDPHTQYALDASLGTAAAEDVGTAIGDVVQLANVGGFPGLPAVDGSQLTGLPSGVSDHGALTGLVDDDHTQYFNQTRGDARYSQLGHNHSGVYDPAGTAATAVSSHETTYNHANFITASGVTYENLSANGDIGTGAAQVAQGNHTHASLYQPLDTELTQLAALTNTANKLIRMTGSNFELIDDTIPIQLSCSDLTTDLATGTSKAYFRMPFAATLVAVRASVLTAPTGSVLTVDINENGTSVLGTKLTIDAGEKTSTTAASAATITDSALADDSEITIDIDGVGSTTAGKGLVVTLLVRR